MHVISQNEVIWCKVIASTLTGKATTLFGRLPNDSIHSWKNLKKIFLAEFGAAGTMIKGETYLFEMRKDIGESISSYITRFKKELDSVEVIKEKSGIIYFIGGLHYGPLKTKLMLRGPKNMVDMFLVAQKMASAGENKEDRGNNSKSKTGKDRVDDDQNDMKDVSKSTQRGRTTDT